MIFKLYESVVRLSGGSLGYAWITPKRFNLALSRRYKDNVDYISTDIPMKLRLQ